MLEECRQTADRLLEEIRTEREDIRNGISGEVLEAYEKAAERAEELTEKLSRNLIVLQSGQTPEL